MSIIEAVMLDMNEAQVFVAGLVGGAEPFDETEDELAPLAVIARS